MIRVGFILNFSNGIWLGGASYYRNLFSAISNLPAGKIKPVLIAASGRVYDLRNQFPDVEVIGLPLLNAPAIVTEMRRVARVVSGRDFLLDRALRMAGIDILSHSGYLGRHASLPSIVWIPDFQELTFPEFFSRRELVARRRNAANCCRNASTIMLSSDAALRDLRSINCGCTYTAVLPFVASVPAEEALLTKQEITSRYEIQGDYFHLPNQLWIHKNHAVVLQSLALLRAQRKSVVVVATGNLADPRQPGHFSTLMATARSLGLDDSFRVLGVVPYIDLMSLMRHAVAVINPSKFEGWSTTVEEAKSMGKAVVVSDIPVHREQNPARAAFFAPDNAEQLAQLLSESIRNWNAAADDVAVQRAAVALPLRREAFARNYEEIVLETIARHAAGRKRSSIQSH
jgi:glycosyltransferase involved in cell wall biosynthesis